MKIYVAGHQGLVGSAVTRAIEKSADLSWVGYTHSELDLCERNEVFTKIAEEKPDALVIAAAKVGGIIANQTMPVEFLSENLQIQTNLLDAAHENSVSRVIFLGSSCIYPKECPQPIQENYLLTGPLEETNEPYALAKIAGVKLVEAYNREYGHSWVSMMPTNLYGPNDNFHPENSHVIPALIRRFTEAADMGSDAVTLWGDGSPLREFMHSDDLARAVIAIIRETKLKGLVNVGSGFEISIATLAQMISELSDFDGDIKWDPTKPNGTRRKILDSKKIRSLGWQPRVNFYEGLAETLAAFRSSRSIFPS